MLRCFLPHAFLPCAFLPCAFLPCAFLPRTFLQYAYAPDGLPVERPRGKQKVKYLGLLLQKKQSAGFTYLIYVYLGTSNSQPPDFFLPLYNAPQVIQPHSAQHFLAPTQHEGLVLSYTILTPIKMLAPAFVDVNSTFFPLGNTPAVSLTQTIPPGEPVDILLLGCGDARHILFTGHIDVNCELLPGGLLLRLGY